MAGDTRTRLIAEALRLFAEKGYDATSVSEIEAAAGLSGGSGSLYRHFESKRDLLAAGVRSQIASAPSLDKALADPRLVALPIRERLLAVARAGLARLTYEGEFNRLMIRDLRRFPDLLEEARVAEVERIHTITAVWLADQFPDRQGADWEATAAVLVGAVSHLWLLHDIFGDHPAGVGDERYLAALVAAIIPIDQISEEEK